MDYIEPFADFRHDLWCIHCGTSKETNSFTRDHLPTKSLLDRPLPTDLPTFAICADCNNSLSRDEEYLKVFLACILDGTCEPSEMSDPKIGRGLARPFARRTPQCSHRGRGRKRRGTFVLASRPVAYNAASHQEREGALYL